MGDSFIEYRNFTWKRIWVICPKTVIWTLSRLNAYRKEKMITFTIIYEIFLALYKLFLFLF